jgi:hypothetical protein
MMGRGDAMDRVTAWLIVVVTLLAGCAGNRPPGWPSRALVTDVPDSTLLVWEAVLQAYHASPGRFHPYGNVKALPVVLRERGRRSVPATWAARLVADSVLDGVCDDGAMLNCWSDVHARYLDFGRPARLGGDTLMVRIDFTQETTGLCGTASWSEHQYIWTTEARVVAVGSQLHVVGDSVVRIIDEAQCSITLMSASEMRAHDRARTLGALTGCYALALTADSAHLLDMKRSLTSWTDTTLRRIIVDTVALDSTTIAGGDGTDHWRLTSGFSRDPNSSWTWKERQLHLEMGNLFVLRRVDLWPTMIPDRFEGRGHELTDASQEYFYTAQATRLGEACGPP